jgi:hypothetical protein
VPRQVRLVLRPYQYRRDLVACLVIGLASGSAWCADPYSARIERLDPPTEISEAQRGLLDPSALLVRSDTGDLLRCWFRRELPVKATDQELRTGATTAHLVPGAFVGALELPKPFVDYRKQRIPAGIYTLRFAIQPDTGEHTDTAPHRQFFLISRAADDRLVAEIQPKPLIELSSKANEGRHPAVILLWPDAPPGSTPAVIDKGSNVFAVTVRRPASAGKRQSTLVFAMTIAGYWRQ